MLAINQSFLRTAEIHKFDCSKLKFRPIIDKNEIFKYIELKVISDYLRTICKI